MRHTVRFPSPPVELRSFLSPESDHSHSTGLLESRRMGCFYPLSGCGFASRVCGDCFSFCLTSRLLIVSHDHRPTHHRHRPIGLISAIQYSKFVERRSTSILLAYCTVPRTIWKVGPFPNIPPNEARDLPHILPSRNNEESEWGVLCQKSNVMGSVMPVCEN